MAQSPLFGRSGRRRQPSEIGGTGPSDPDPEANTLDCYQTGASADAGIPAAAAILARPLGLLRWRHDSDAALGWRRRGGAGR